MKTTTRTTHSTTPKTTPQRSNACPRRSCRKVCRIENGMLRCLRCGWSELEDLRQRVEEMQWGLYRDLLRELTTPFLSSRESRVYQSHGERVARGMRRSGEKAVRP